MVALLVVAVALGLNNFGAAIAIGVGGVDRRTEIKVATVFGLCDVVMPAIGMLIGTGLAGPLGSAARGSGTGGGCWSAAPPSAWTTSRWAWRSGRCASRSCWR
jgi:hypothetical protein